MANKYLIFVSESVNEQWIVTCSLHFEEKYRIFLISSQDVFHLNNPFHTLNSPEETIFLEASLATSSDK